MTRLTSPKLEALHASIATAINAQHEQEIRDDIRREEEHLRTCPFAKVAKSERDLDEYDRLLKVSADIIDATAQALGIPKSAENKETILKAIRELKTTAEKTPLLFGGMNLGGAARDMAMEVNIDRLLDAYKAPRRYEDGSPLTRAERVEWLGRRAPKT